MNLRLLGPIKLRINIAHDLKNDGSCVREVALDNRTRAAMIVISGQSSVAEVIFLSSYKAMHIDNPMMIF